MSDPLPTTMRALLLEQHHEDAIAAIDGLRVVERPVPSPGPGQVLVKIEAAPCNPSDLLLLQGNYGAIKTLPTVPGWEGAGRVVASGRGWLARWLNGKRVACGVQTDRDGTWAEYFLAEATDCIPLKRQTPIEQAASLIVNPLTACGLLDVARRNGHQAAVHTAGASQLGRMLLPLARDMDFPLIAVVRRAAQVELLQAAGAEHVLDSSGPAFADELRDRCARLKATAAFEAVAGEMTGTVLNLMPPGSTVYVYGALAEEPCSNIDPIELIFRGKTVNGFYLGSWLQQRGKLATLRLASRVQRLLSDGHIQTRFQRRLTLDEAVEGLKHYVTHMTDGKVLITPARSGGGEGPGEGEGVME